MSLISKIIIFVKKQIVDIKTYGSTELLRKFYLLIKVFFIIPFYLVAIPTCLIIRLISPWIIIRTIRLPAGNFGDFIIFAGIYYCKKKLKINQPKKKHFDLMYIDQKDKFYNKQLLKMWKRKLNFFSGRMLGSINKVHKLMPGWRTFIDLNERENRDINNLFEKIQPLEFTKEEKAYGKEMLSKFGLKDKDKFVCLAVRDGSFQLKKFSTRFRNWDYHNFRHIDIDKFVLAAEELTKRGYYVFRMGVVVEKSMTTNNPMIIDYASSNMRSDFMDIYLGANCSFLLGTGFGFQDLPTIFKKPLALISVPLGNLHSYSEKFLHLTKHHVLKKENRRLSLSEIFSHGVAYAYFSNRFEEKGIELVENTQEEIRDLAIEMVESLENNKKLNFEDEKLQETFRNLYTSNLRNSADEKMKNYPPIIHGQIRCRYGTQFLKENKNWLR